MIFYFFNFLSSPKPDPPRNLTTQIFFEFVKVGCQFSLSRQAVPYLGTWKGKGFLSFDCVFPGQPDMSICVAEVAGRTRTIFIEEFAKVLWARFFRDLKVTIFDCVSINCCMVFHSSQCFLYLYYISILLLKLLSSVNTPIRDKKDTDVILARLQNSKVKIKIKVVLFPLFLYNVKFP